MSKKGQAVQLQTDVHTDDEWTKLLQRDGLIVVDIYSEWCGSCTGMTATLKKIKMEIGGDLLQLATAKSDHIEALERFRNRSEPTWMFIVNGKMVNFMYGVNVPKLTRLITDELKRERDIRAGHAPERTDVLEISQLADEERDRQEAIDRVENEARAIEEEKVARERRERLTTEAHQISDALTNVGVVIVFPHARTKYMEVLSDLLFESGLQITSTEKIVITAKHLDGILYYAEDEEIFEEDLLENLAEKEEAGEKSFVLLIKLQKTAPELTTTMDEAVLRIVYGKGALAPGDKGSPADVLRNLPQVMDAEDEGAEQNRILTGIWVPPSQQLKAIVLKTFFPNLCISHLIPEPEPIPDHYMVAFEAMKRNEVAELMDKYQQHILHYGFFTSINPQNAELVANNFYRYERTTPKTFEEKLIIQLSSKKSECVFAFMQLRPLHISANTIEGKKDCRILFPDDYVQQEDDEEGSFILPSISEGDALSAMGGASMGPSIGGDDQGAAEEDYTEGVDEENEEENEEEDTIQPSSPPEPIFDFM